MKTAYFRESAGAAAGGGGLSGAPGAADGLPGVPPGGFVGGGGMFASIFGGVTISDPKISVSGFTGDAATGISGGTGAGAGATGA